MEPKKANTAQSQVKGQELTSKPWFSETKKKANSTFERSFVARKTVNVEPLKSFVLQNFPKGPFRDAVLAERSVLTIPEFLGKCETWQNLLRVVLDDR